MLDKDLEPDCDYQPTGREQVMLERVAEHIEELNIIMIDVSRLSYLGKLDRELLLDSLLNLRFKMEKTIDD